MICSPEFLFVITLGQSYVTMKGDHLSKLADATLFASEADACKIARMLGDDKLEVISLEKALEAENAIFKAFVLKMGDRLVSNAEKLSNNAERTKANILQLREKYLNDT